MAQQVARGIWDAEVADSSSVAPTNKKTKAILSFGQMLELVNRIDLGSIVVRLAGSSPASPTKKTFSANKVSPPWRQVAQLVER